MAASPQVSGQLGPEKQDQSTRFDGVARVFGQA
jgi:hypothetical protein